MKDVVEHLYNKPCNGEIVIDDKIKAAIDAYYEPVSYTHLVNEMKKRVITMKKGVIVSDEQEGGYKHED